MDQLNKTRWQVRIAAVVIFFLGFAAGALALNAYRAWSRTSLQSGRQDQFEQMLERLNLNPEQKAQVQQILGNARDELRGLRKESEPRVTEIRQRADERMQKVLTPEQWQQFQQMREEMRGKRRRTRDAKGDD
jgi:Spy/CpxP family protein refolding chaperone